MLDDVVVDTNIFGHAQDPNTGVLFDEAAAFLERLLTVETPICFDGEVEANRSRVLAEYERVMFPTGLAAPVLTRILVERRYKELSPRVPHHVRTIVNALLPVAESMDKLFVCLAYVSEESVLVSHDDNHLTHDVRQRAEQRLGVRMLDAVDCTPEL